MQDLEHSMNLVSCDMSLNKIMHRYLVDVENGLLVNQKFRHGAKNRAIQHELNAKRIASK